MKVARAIAPSVTVTEITVNNMNSTKYQEYKLRQILTFKMKKKVA